MPRYRVEVSRPEIHFVDADRPEDASDAAIALVESRMKPAYYLSPVVDVDVCVQTHGHFAVLEGVGSGNDTAAGPGGTSDSIVTSASSEMRDRQTVEPSQASAPPIGQKAPPAI